MINFTFSAPDINLQNEFKYTLVKLLQRLSGANELRHAVFDVLSVGLLYSRTMDLEIVFF